MIFVFAHANFKQGFRSTHLKAVGKALEAVFQLILQGEEWNAKAVEAWQWFWSIISSTMQSELEALETHLCDVVLLNWEQVKDTTDVESLGQKFWVQLNDEAPEQTKIFRRPLKMWGSLLHHIMDMLIVSIKEPERFFDELFALTIRHIRYGVRPEYLQPFGNALLATLEELLVEEWTERAQKAWKMVWKRAADSIARGLNVGGNALTYALVDGDVQALQCAVMPAPRSVRARMLCRMEIEGAVLSPLFWALHDGKVDITEFILRDLLTIRADLHGYYYGCSELFEHHKNLVEEIGNEEPALYTVLLDGLMWHSRKKVEGGMVVVNYYIKDIYGDPDDYGDPWRSPLAHLIFLADNDTIKHPVVTKVIDMKWKAFGLKMFLAKESWFILHLFLFMVVHLGDPDGCAHEQYDILKIVLGTIATLTLLMGLFMIARQIYFNKTIAITLPLVKWTLNIPRTLTSAWSQLRNISMILLLVVYVMPPEPCQSQCAALAPVYDLDALGVWELANSTGCLPPGNMTDLLADMPPLSTVTYAQGGNGTIVGAKLPSERSTRRLQAVAALLMWIQLLQSSIISKAMAAFSYSVGSMLKDLLHTLFLILVLMLAFGSALSILEEDPFNAGFDVTLVLLLQEVLGVAQPSYMDVSSGTRCLLLLFVLLVTVVMLNVLIAQLTITYERVISNMEAHALKHRASLCLDMEAFLPLSWRKKIFQRFGFDKPLPFEGPSDLGPAGGIQVQEPDDHKYYVPDRIFRFTGDASPQDPWPDINDELKDDEEEELN
eukprot:Tamp_04185.p1 GENE.Tamp_04185~~Tamp_04185.p1  ORF type:complete len:777 (+),score=205.16 Tamp_04185:586-2916(+)